MVAPSNRTAPSNKSSIWCMVCRLILLALMFADLSEAQKEQTKLGSIVRLNCANFVDNGTKVAWYKAKKRIKASNRFVFKRTNLVLKIKNIKEQDLGVYTCNNVTNAKRGGHGKELVAYNVAYSDNDSIEDKKPQWKNLSQMLKQQYLANPTGATARLSCDAKGEAPINYKWLKNGKPFLDRRIDSSFQTVNKPQIRMRDLVMSDSANYTCIAKNKYGFIDFHFQVQIQERPRHRPILESGVPANMTVIYGENITIPCYEIISGTLSDYRWLQWKQNWTPNKNRIHEIVKAPANWKNSTQYVLIDPMYNKIIQKESFSMPGRLYGVGLGLNNVSEANEGWYTCLVSNHIGSSAASMYLSVRPPYFNEPPTEPTLSMRQDPNQIVYIMAGIVGVVIIIIAAIIGRCYSKKIKRLGRDPETGAIIYDRSGRLHSSTSGMNSQAPLLSVGRDGSIRSDTELRMPHLNMFPPEFDEVFKVPLDEEWDVDPSCLQITETLGEGAFGVVMKGTAVGLKRCGTAIQNTTVAIKMLKSDATRNELSDLLSELATMKSIGQNVNIINLLGCCTQSNPVYVIVEFAPHGNLRQFLRTRRPNSNESEPQLTVKDMLSFSLQIAKGMDYLSQRRVIHRDLAARNILMGEDYVLKIADFGLARSVHEMNYYRKTTDGRLPIKWLAIEALFDHVYTTQSDVWAYGILLWEIFTLGGSPYPSIPVENLFDLLKTGYRMEKPQICPYKTYDIMMRCWYEMPLTRPSFQNLIHEFESLMEQITGEDYVEVLASESIQSLPTEDGGSGSDQEGACGGSSTELVRNPHTSVSDGAEESSQQQAGSGSAAASRDNNNTRPAPEEAAGSSSSSANTTKADVESDSVIGQTS